MKGEAFGSKWVGKPLALIGLIKAKMPTGQQQDLGDRDRLAVSRCILLANGLDEDVAALRSADKAGTISPKIESENEREWKPESTGFHNRSVQNFSAVTEAMLDNHLPVTG